MRIPRVRIRTVMICVAILAANLAVAKALSTSEYGEFAILSLVPFVLLQGTTWLTIQRRSRTRAFWLGYTVIGALVTGSLVWLELVGRGVVDLSRWQFLTSLTLTLEQPWLSYFNFTMGRLDRFLGPGFPNSFRTAELAIETLVASTPQILIALAGGFISRAACAILEPTTEAA